MHAFWCSRIPVLAAIHQHVIPLQNLLTHTLGKIHPEGT